MWIKFCLIYLAFILLSCKGESSKDLPYIGPEKIVNGEKEPHSIREFSFLNQDSLIVTNDSLKDYIYLVDFFFTSCPSICPKVTKQMMRMHDAFIDEPRIKLVSFTLDPKRDSPSRLKQYAENLGINQSKWLFLSGDRDVTYELAKDYLVSALLDDEAPGGINHSGTIVLVDKDGHVRSFSDGTDADATPKLIEDAKKLLSEFEK